MANWIILGLQIKNKKNTIINIDADPALNRRPIVFTPKKPIINIPTYHLKADKLDNRDYLYQPLGVDIASSIDLRPFCSPIENQGALGSCTGQAVAGAIELINKRNIIHFHKRNQRQGFQAFLMSFFVFELK